jgi:hypothetical protein
MLSDARIQMRDRTKSTTPNISAPFCEMESAPTLTEALSETRVFDSDVIIRDIETCISFGVLLTLMSMAIFSWLLVIGISFMLTFKGVVVENRMYYVMCLLGWFMPTVATITWPR